MVTNRRIIRTIFDDGSPAETTSSTSEINASSLPFVVETSHFFYVGFHGKFAARHFQMDTVNTNSVTLTVKQFDGTSFVAVEDLVDQTSGFTQSGFISWSNEVSWVANEVVPVTSTDGEDLKMFWIQISVSSNLSAGTSLFSVLNLFSDNDAVSPLYPELISDTRFLPSGQTNFLKQHQEAKNRVVRRLNQKRVITDESQIIDVNEVSEAAVHAFADIVLSPISTSEALIIIRDDARRNFESELTRVNLGVDKNESGKVSKKERESNQGFIIRR